MTAIIIGGWAAFIPFIAPAPMEPPPPPITVVATAYSCDNHPDNPMFPCNTTRWGYDPYQPGAACPPDWAHIAISVPGRGVMVCDDTPLHSTLYGLPHVDIRVISHEEAVQWGIREIQIYQIAPMGQERKGR